MGTGRESKTYIIEVNIYPTIMREHKISNGVRPLDGLGVVVEGVQEPGVLGSDELARLGIGPQLESSRTNQLPPPTHPSLFPHMQTHLVLVILMQIHTALLCLPPSLRHGVVDVGLVNDLGDELRPVVDAWGVRGRDVGAVDGVGGAVFDEEGEEGEYGADEDDYY